jgi:hypothetical protein
MAMLARLVSEFRLVLGSMLELSQKAKSFAQGIRRAHNFFHSLVSDRRLGPKTKQARGGQKHGDAEILNFSGPIMPVDLIASFSHPAILWRSHQMRFSVQRVGKLYAI